MEQAGSAIGVAPRPPAPLPRLDPGAAVTEAHVTEAHVEAHVTEAHVTDRFRLECELLARRMHDEHPEVPLARISDLVERASDDLAGSKVQSFKLILVERAVRRELGTRR